jgi:transposase
MERAKARKAAAGGRSCAGGQMQPTGNAPSRGVGRTGQRHALYREGNLIERFFNKLKHFRRIATRYDNTARNLLAAVFCLARQRKG